MLALSWAAPAGATTTNPYSGTGYDVGFPNCGETPPPSSFAIVGLGSGRAFKTNGCLASEWSTAVKDAGATPGPALYFNTGYTRAFGRDVTASCATYQGPSLKGLPRHDQNAYSQAWEIGCSEAAYAATVAKANNAKPSMWWADIETGNSWSTNPKVNQYAVDGISAGMHQAAPGMAAGVYSYAAAWTTLVGSGFSATPPFTADWGPHLTCGTTGFSGAPVWVVQNGTTTSGVDTDSGCG